MAARAHVERAPGLADEPGELFARIDQQRRLVVGRLLWLLAALVATVMIFIYRDFGGAAWSLPSFYVNLVTLPILAAALWFNRRGRFDVAIVIVMVILLVAGAVPVLLTGLPANPLSLLVLAVPIVLAGLVSTRPAVLGTTAWGVGSIVAATLLQEFEALPANLSAARPDWWFATQAAVLLVVIAYLLDRFGFVLRATLTDALEAQATLRQRAAEHLRAQAALLEEQQFSTAIVENLPGLFTLLGRDGRFTRWNNNFPRVIGLSESELAAATLEQVIGARDHDEVRQHVRRVFEQGHSSTEASIVTRDGTEVPYLLSGSRVELGGKEYVAGMAIDRSELKFAMTRIEAMSEELEERLERITALHRIDQAITGSLDLNLTLDVVLEQVTSRLKVDGASILLFKPANYTLVFGASKGLKSRALEDKVVPLGEGPAGRAALSREKIVLSSAAELAAAFPNLDSVVPEGFEGYIATPLVAKGDLQGVLETFLRRPLELDANWHDYLNTLATQAAIALDNTTLFQNLERSNLELRLAYDRTIEGWARALDLRDEETEGHSRRVTDLTVRLAERMGVSPENLVHVRRGALLHDIGKMGIPDQILLKPGKLSEQEWEIMRRHPTYATELLAPIEFLAPALPIPRCHHERWDGSGYPAGLKGEQIPLAARIFAVVDVYDALTSDRPYREAWTKERGIEHIASESGAHFDPAVVDEFMALLRDEGL